jgi:hypothetical protein
LAGGLGAVLNPDGELEEFLRDGGSDGLNDSLDGALLACQDADEGAAAVGQRLQPAPSRERERLSPRLLQEITQKPASGRQYRGFCRGSQAH